MTKKTHSKVAVIITAAGSSTRLGGGVKKEYLSYKNGTVLSACATVFLSALYNHSELCEIVVTCPAGGIENAKNALFADENVSVSLKKNANVRLSFVEGGKSRQASVFEGLKTLKKSDQDIDYVLIHDGARPFISGDLVSAVFDATVEYGAAVPGLTPTDTQKEVDSHGFIVRHLVRKSLVAVQTPQGFEFERLFEAHKKAEKLAHENPEKEFTDDTEIWGEFCGDVKVVQGMTGNLKITYLADLEKL